MKTTNDPLYQIFEEILYSSLVEIETSEELVNKVVSAFLDKLNESGTVPAKLQEGLKKDLQDEVTEMLRKKTYGHVSLTSFKSSQTTKSPTRPRRRSI